MVPDGLPIAWALVDATDGAAVAQALGSHFELEQLDAPEISRRLLDLPGSRCPDLLVLRWRDDESASLIARLRVRHAAEGLPILAIASDERALHAALLAGANDALVGAHVEQELLARARARARARVPRVGGGPDGSNLHRLWMQAPLTLAVVSGSELELELVNPRFERLVGRSDLLGTRLGELASSLPDESMLATLERVYTTGEAHTTAELLVRVNLGGEGKHEPAFMQFTYQPIFDEQGHVRAIFVVGVDVTRQVQACRRVEQLATTMERSGQLFRMLADNAPDVIIRVDRNLRHLFVNKAIEEVSGIPVERFLGATGHEAGLAPELAAAWNRQVMRVFAEQQPLDVELRFASQRGPAVVESRMVPEFGPDGQVESVLVISRDITEREQAKRALADSERRFRATFDNAAVGIAHIGLDGRWLHVNDRVVDILGYERDELLAMTWQDVTHPADLEIDLGLATGLMGGPTRGYSLEKRYLRKDGSTAWINLTVSLVRAPTGEPEYYVSIIEDIGARKQVEAALRESDRQKDEFLAMLGHELRNPVAAIRLASELLPHTASSDAKLHKIRSVLIRQTAHIARLLDDLLDISRISRGKLVLASDTLDLVAVVRQALDDRLGPRRTETNERGSRGAQGLEVRVSLPDEPLWVEGDATRLAQVIDNLLANAIKYTSPPGCVDIEASSDDEQVQVRVRDSGVGLDPEFQERIFQPFQQAPQDIARSAGGLGLGLAITKAIVEMHCGSIEAHSEGRNRGTEFVVQLPRARSAAPQPHDRERTTKGEAGLRVLIVEDNPDTAELLLELLGLLGHVATLARTGSQALAQVADARVDVILCDIGLPDMSGYEVARAVRADPRLRATRLIAVSGYGQPEDRRRSQDAGFSVHLTKPVSLDAISAVLTGEAVG